MAYHHAPLPVLGTLLVAALVAYRVTRLIVVDSLFEGWRWRFRCWVYDDPGDLDSDYRLVTPRRGGQRTIWALTLARGKLGDLASCVYCVGVWASAGVVLGAWGLGWLPGGWALAVWIPAVAGLQALLSAIDNLITGSAHEKEKANR